MKIKKVVPYVASISLLVAGVCLIRKNKQNKKINLIEESPEEMERKRHYIKLKEDKLENIETERHYIKLR